MQPSFDVQGLFLALYFGIIFGGDWILYGITANLTNFKTIVTKNY